MCEVPDSGRYLPGCGRYFPGETDGKPKISVKIVNAEARVLNPRVLKDVQVCVAVIEGGRKGGRVFPGFAVT